MKWSARVTGAVAVSVLSLTGALSAADPAAQPAAAPAGGSVVLDWGHSYWRHHLTFRAPRFDPPFEDARGRKIEFVTYGRGCQVGGPGGPVSSPQAPADWMQPQFDDSSWARSPRPEYGTSYYEPVVRVENLRGKFEVADPARVTGLHLQIEYIGGVAVWLNGHEVARRHLPAGPLTAEIMAEGYPEEAYEWGMPRPRNGQWSSSMVGPMEWGPLSNPKAERWRKLAVTLDPARLRQGVNVLAVSLHQSSFNRFAMTWQNDWLGGCRRVTGRAAKSAVEAGKGQVDGDPATGMKTHLVPWPHLLVKTLTLRASPADSARLAQRPGGLQVWAADIHHRFRPQDFGEADCKVPGEAPAVARIVAARNGTHSAQVVVGTTEPLAGLTATVSDFVRVGGPGRIGADAVRVRYALGIATDPKTPDALIMDHLSDRPPATVAANSCQPVWITIKVPKDAVPGEYRGTLTLHPGTRSGVSAVREVCSSPSAFSSPNLSAFPGGKVPDGTLKPVEVRVQVMDWTLPDSREYASYVGLRHAFWGAPAQYKIQPWAEEHWKHLERVVKWLGEVGNDLVNLPLICGGEEDGEESLVAWIRKGNGFDYDWTTLDRYLDLVAKYWGTRVAVVGEICSAPYGKPTHRYGVAEEQSRGSGFKLDPTVVTVRGEKAPLILKPGSDEWKAHFLPFAKALHRHLKEKGFETLHWGWFHDWVPDGTVSMGAALAQEMPDVGWARASHYGRVRRAFPKASKAQVTLDERIRGWSLSFDRKSGQPVSRCGWNQTVDVHFPRVASMIQAVGTFDSPMALHRLTENSLVHGAAGFARLGADFWPSRPLPYSWFGVCMTESYLLYPGPEGADGSQRFEALREGIQEAEVRIWLERNGKDQTEPAKTVLADRIRGTLSAMAAGEPSAIGGYYAGWQEMSWDLYAAAALAAGGKAPAAEDKQAFFGPGE